MKYIFLFIGFLSLAEELRFEFQEHYTKANYVVETSAFNAINSKLKLNVIALKSNQDTQRWTGSFSLELNGKIQNLGNQGIPSFLKELGVQYYAGFSSIYPLDASNRWNQIHFYDSEKTKILAGLYSTQKEKGSQFELKMKTVDEDVSKNTYPNVFVFNTCKKQ